MARAMPVCAIIASRLACAFVSTASVTTTTSVVFSEDAAGPPLRRALSMSGVNAGGRPRPPNSLAISNGAAQNHGPSPTVTLPTALTTASAATVAPPSVCAEAEPRAGVSKRIAVTPEAMAASWAWPTRTPAISVSRFFKASVRGGLHRSGRPTDISAAGNASTGKRQPDHPGELGFAIGFCQQQHAGIQPAMMDDGVFCIARSVQRLQCRPPLQGLVNQLAAIHVARHDHVGEKQVEGGYNVDDLQRVG